MRTALAQIGHEVTSRQVRKDFARGAPKTSPEDYVTWLQANEQREPRKGKGNPGLAALREQKLTEEIAVLKIKKAQGEAALAEQAGRLVEIEKVHDQSRRVFAKVRAVLTQKFETELPPKLDGCPAVDIAEANRKALDEVFAILSTETYA